MNCTECLAERSLTRLASGCDCSVKPKNRHASRVCRFPFSKYQRGQGVNPRPDVMLRVNTRIDRSQIRTAHLGERAGEQHTGVTYLRTSMPAASAASVLPDRKQPQAEGSDNTTRECTKANAMTSRQRINCRFAIEGSSPTREEAPLRSRKAIIRM